jgi:hypothetical protein
MLDLALCRNVNYLRTSGQTRATGQPTFTAITCAARHRPQARHRRAALPGRVGCCKAAEVLEDVATGQQAAAQQAVTRERPQ